MADKSLDDFFAKKDKSKKKSKSKSASFDPEVKQSEADTSVPKKDKKKKEKEKTQPSTTSEPSSVKQEEVPEDEEWKELEEEKEVDYSGLRIQNLQISKEEEEREDEEKEDEEVDEDGEVKEKKDTTQGPWKQSTSTQPPPSVPAPQPVVEVKPKEEVPAPKTAGKYVPPGARGGAAMPAATPLVGPSRKKKNAPNLHSEEDFPTLGGAGKPITEFIESDSRGGNFERVQAGGRQMGDPSQITPQLSLGNKYAALQD